MTKQSEGHLTTEQISALLDKQLSAQEQALVDAHLQTCQLCQLTLAQLRQTVALLHALPQVEVPRSFTLPARLSIIQEQPASNNPSITPISQRKRARQNNLQIAFRAVSTLAAVLGVIFILSFFTAGLPHGGASTASSGTSSTYAPSATNHAATPSSQHPTAGTGTNPGAAGSPAISVPTPTSTALPSQVVKPASTSTGPPSQHSPASLDLGGPTNRLLFGSALLVLGILGFALTRRR